MNVRRGPLNSEESEEMKELYKDLRRRIEELRIQWLFEEPSTYEDDIDDDEHMW